MCVCVCVCVCFPEFNTGTLSFSGQTLHHESSACEKLECLKTSDPSVCAKLSSTHTHTHTRTHARTHTHTHRMTFLSDNTNIQASQSCSYWSIIHFHTTLSRVFALHICLMEIAVIVVKAVIYRRVEDPADSRRGKNNNKRGIGSNSVSMRHLRGLTKKGEKKET